MREDATPNTGEKGNQREKQASRHWPFAWPVALEHCTRQLRQCCDPEAQLLTRQIRDGRWQTTVGTEPITSTAISLIGLSRAGVPFREVFINPAVTCSRIAELTRKRSYFGGLGLLLWASSVLDLHSPRSILRLGGLENPETHLLPKLTTMELAWWISGLLHVNDPDLNSLRDGALRELRARWVLSTRTFLHCSAAAAWTHRVRLNIANFADQIYPVQALAFSALALHDDEALELAEEAAARLTDAQGPLGQWWWHYNAFSGEVVGKYPVYSVHQHSMAPMCLHCLKAAGGPSYDKAVGNGQAWLTLNETSESLVDNTTGVVWRSVEVDESRVTSITRKARTLFGKPDTGHETSAKVNREMRPYEWGWLLYAMALEHTTDPGRHLV